MSSSFAFVVGLVSKPATGGMHNHVMLVRRPKRCLMSLSSNPGDDLRATLDTGLAPRRLCWSGTLKCYNLPSSFYRASVAADKSPLRVYRSSRSICDSVADCMIPNKPLFFSFPVLQVWKPRNGVFGRRFPDKSGVVALLCESLSWPEHQPGAKSRSPAVSQHVPSNHVTCTRGTPRRRSWEC